MAAPRGLEFAGLIGPRAAGGNARRALARGARPCLASGAWAASAFRPERGAFWSGRLAAAGLSCLAVERRLRPPRRPVMCNPICSSLDIDSPARLVCGAAWRSFARETLERDDLARAYTSGGSARYARRDYRGAIADLRSRAPVRPATTISPITAVATRIICCGTFAARLPIIEEAVRLDARA